MTDNQNDVIGKNPVGRPPVITDPVLDQIFHHLSLGLSEYKTITKIIQIDWSTWTKYKQRNIDNLEFITKYAQSKESGYKVWEDRIVEISDDESRDQVPDGKGGYKSDNTAVNRDRLRVDSRKWLMSKLLPKTYGEKIEQTISAQLSQPQIQINIKTNDCTTVVHPNVPRGTLEETAVDKVEQQLLLSSPVQSKD
jgi:hypothetical protein